MNAEAALLVACRRLHRTFDQLVQADPGHKALLSQLCASIGGACSIGHRTCHCVWGLCGSGKLRLMQAVASHFRRDARARRLHLVVEIQTSPTITDDDAIAALFEALRDYFLRMRAARLTATADAAATVTQVLRILQRLFEIVLPQVLHGDGVDASDTVSHTALRWHVSTAVSARLFSSVGTTALDALQRALVEVNQAGLSLVVLASDITEFSLGCDRVAYMLSDLMHQCPTRAGGISLIYGASSSDFSLEKRLSSRLCCESWHCSMPSVSVSSLLLGVLETTSTWLRDSPDFVTDFVQRQFTLKVKPEEITNALTSLHRAIAGCKTCSVALSALDDRVALFGRGARYVREFVSSFLGLVDPSSVLDNASVVVPRLLTVVEAAMGASPHEWLLGSFGLRCEVPLTATETCTAAPCVGGTAVVVSSRPLSREAVIIMCVTVMQHRAVPINPLTLQDTHAVAAARFTAEATPLKLAAYGEGLDFLLERKLLLLSPNEAILLNLSLDTAIAFVSSVLASDGSAAAHGVAAERVHLRGIAGLS